MYLQKKRAILIGIFSGMVILFFGFIIMYIMWELIGNPQELRGFFFYRAATIGDGICLPILVGSATAFNWYNNVFCNQGRKISLLMSLVASLIAVIIQASWLIRDDTVLNWSIPIKHHFNVAGWYHSIFFIVIFGVVSYQICEIWFVLRERQVEYLWFEKVLYSLFVFAGVLFLFMHITDDYSQYLSTPLLLVIVAGGTLIMLVVYLKTANGLHNEELLPATVMGVISAYSMSLMICMPARGNIIIAIGGGLCACFIWRLHNLSVTQIVCKDVWTTICYFVALYKISNLTGKELVCSLLFLIVVTAICEEKSNKEARFRTISLLAVEGYLLLNIFPMEIREIDIFINLLFMAVIYSLFKKEIKDYFAEVIKAEEQLGTNQINSQRFKEIKGKAYLQITIGILAAVALIIHWLFATVNVIEIGSKAGDLYIPEEIIGIMLLIIGILLIFGTAQMRKHAAVKIVTVFLSVFLHVGLTIIIVINIGVFSFLSWSPLKWVMLACSACACIGTGVLSAHGYYMNMVWLRGLQKKKTSVGMAMLQLICGMSLTFAITVLILCQQTGKCLLLIGIATVTGFIVIPLLHGRVFQYEHRTFHVVGNKPLGGIAQDGLMICLIVFFVICMPCLYISLSEKNISAWLGAVFLVVTAFPPIQYCLRNNVEHMKRQRKLLVNYPEEEDMWNVLQECLVRQSKQTIFATMPYVCVAVAAAYGSRMMKSMERGEILKDILNTYIDADDYKSEENDNEEDD